MPLPSFADLVVVVEDPTLVNDHGSQVADWSQPPARSQEVAGCWAEPLSSQELLTNAQGTEAVWRVLLPPQDAAGAPTVVASTSRLRFAGVPHDVDGRPLTHPSPTGGVDHVEVLCKAWEG